jgi:hypothetical protein
MISTQMIKIYKIHSHYTLEAGKECLLLKPLFESLIETQLLNFSFMEENKLHFHAESVCLLDKFLDKNKKQINNQQINMNFEKILCLLFSISKQMECLEQKGYTFYGLNLKDIIVINNTYFFILNTNVLVPIEDSNISFYYPFEKPYFTSPEILAIDTLPTKISFKSIYYSLGALIIFCLFDINILKGNDFLSDLEIDAILLKIYGTKLFWCLKRTLMHNYSERHLLYI